MAYSGGLLSNKVYKISNTNTISLNGLEGTSTEVTSTYNTDNNPLISTTLYKNGAATEKTETVSLTYFPTIVSGSSQFIGRLNKKKICQLLIIVIL